MPAAPPAMLLISRFLVLLCVQTNARAVNAVNHGGTTKRSAFTHIFRESGGLPGQLGFWSPAELTQVWDARTLASFSVSQLDAFARIIVGKCPLLSRAVHCFDDQTYDSAKMQVRRDMDTSRRLISAYIEEETEFARVQVVRMMRHIWTNYDSIAFGKDEMKPVSGEGVNNWGGLGQTIVDSLDTLWLMNFHEEFHKAADWVENHLNFDVNVNVNTFETSIRQLGGLISAYALSGKQMLLEKAKDLGDRLMAAYEGVIPRPKKLLPKDSSTKGVIKDLLEQMGLPRSAMDAITGETGEQLVQDLANLPAPQLPFSDVNLRTREVQNMANFVSLSEAYMPVEWKALALYTGNCSYAWPQDEVIRIVNRTSELTSRAFAPILLRPDGSAFPSAENRISIGGRGDSFYEYLLKDWVFSGQEVNPLTVLLWETFRKHLPGLLVLADPANAAQTRASVSEIAPEPRSWMAAFSGRPDTPRRTKRLRIQRRLKRAIQEKVKESPVLPRNAYSNDHSSQSKTSNQRPRCVGGACGGWHESASDAVMPWVFLREVTFGQTVPKMDHLICFLPGTLALDVFHRDVISSLRPSKKQGDKVPMNVSALSVESAAELRLAHKLMQTCIHMYFRTAADLAPEITRFNGEGLVDDLGSMHNILRPETIESLFVMWRTTKAQIYRNWGQRMLSAFSRAQTPFGYASLHNVNEPERQRDDMPSFFVAETVKYLFLLFSPESTLPLQDMVLTTEAHPMPLISKTKGARWKCGKNSAQQAPQSDDTPSEIVSTTTKPTITTPPPVPPPLPPSAVASDVTAPSPANVPAPASDDAARWPGNKDCWMGPFTFELCCFPPKVGNAACWDTSFTYSVCCHIKASA